MKKKLGLSGFVAITSGIISGLFLQLFVGGGSIEFGNSLSLIKILEAVLLVIAVVASIAWATHYYLHLANQEEPDS